MNTITQRHEAPKYRMLPTCEDLDSPRNRVLFEQHQLAGYLGQVFQYAEPTEADRIWAAANLDLPIDVVWADRPVEVLSGGRRRVGRIVVTPVSGPFTIALWRGATVKDFQQMHALAVGAKLGVHDALSLLEWDGDQLARTVVILPDETGPGRALVPCSDPFCTFSASDTPWHIGGIDDEHSCLQAEHEEPGAAWLIDMVRKIDAHEWTLQVDVDADSMTPEQRGLFKAELAFAEVECARANEALHVAQTGEAA